MYHTNIDTCKYKWYNLLTVFKHQFRLEKTMNEQSISFEDPRKERLISLLNGWTAELAHIEEEFDNQTQCLCHWQNILAGKYEGCYGNHGRTKLLEAFQEEVARPQLSAALKACKTTRRAESGDLIAYHQLAALFHQAGVQYWHEAIEHENTLKQYAIYIPLYEVRGKQNAARQHYHESMIYCTDVQARRIIETEFGQADQETELLLKMVEEDIEEWTTSLPNPPVGMYKKKTKAIPSWKILIPHELEYPPLLEEGSHYLMPHLVN